METIVLSSIVNFVVAFSIVIFLARKPVIRFLAARSEGIATEMVEAETLASEASRSLGEWESKVKGSNSESKQMFADAAARAVELKKNALESANAQAVRVKEDGKRLGVSELARAKAKLEREIVVQSVEVAGRYLEKNLNEDDKRNLVGDYVEKIVNGKAR